MQSFIRYMLQYVPKGWCPSPHLCQRFLHGYLSQPCWNKIHRCKMKYPAFSTSDGGKKTAITNPLTLRFLRSISTGNLFCTPCLSWSLHVMREDGSEWRHSSAIPGEFFKCTTLCRSYIFKHFIVSFYSRAFYIIKLWRFGKKLDWVIFNFLVQVTCWVLGLGFIQPTNNYCQCCHYREKQKRFTFKLNSYIWRKCCNLRIHIPLAFLWIIVDFMLTG